MKKTSDNAGSKATTATFAATAKATTGTTAAGDRAAANGAAENRGQAMQQGSVAGDTEPRVATPANGNQCNETWCDLNRLGKAMDAVAIVAGRELATAQRELGDAFDAFIETRTPWNMVEARTLIAFAARAGLTPEGLSPAVAVPLERVLKAVALLGELYVDGMAQESDQSCKE